MESLTFRKGGEKEEEGNIAFRERNLYEFINR